MLPSSGARLNTLKTGLTARRFGMQMTDVPHGKLSSALFNLSRALGDRGDQIVDRLNRDSEFVRRLADFAVAGGFSPMTTIQTARLIMGKNMFDENDCLKAVFPLLGNFPDNRIGQGVNKVYVPFSEETLRLRADTHVLVLVLPITIGAMLGHFKDGRVHGIPIIHRDHGIEGTSANRVGKYYADHCAFVRARWCLIRKNPAEGSGMDYGEQKMIIQKMGEEPIDLQALIFTHIAFLLRNEEGHFRGPFEFRTKKRAPAGRFCAIVHFSKGILIDTISDDVKSAHTRMASMILPDASFF